LSTWISSDLVPYGQKVKKLFVWLFGLQFHHALLNPLNVFCVPLPFQKLSGKMKRKVKGRKKQEKEVLGVFSGKIDVCHLLV